MQILYLDKNYARKRVFFQKNLHSWHKSYTTAGRDGSDKSQLWFNDSFTAMDDNVIVHVQETRLGEHMSGTWMSRSPVLSSTHYFPIQRFAQFNLNSFFFGIIQGWLVGYPEQRNLSHVVWWTFMSKLFRYLKQCISAPSETKIRWNSYK